MLRRTLPVLLIILASPAFAQGFGFSGAAAASRATEEAVAPPVDYALPDPIMTPGQADPSATLLVVCAHNTRSRRHVSTGTRARVFAAYNVSPDHWDDYELDHLIPLAVGGANTAANLWPQPHEEARFKDALEVEIQDRVCAGTLPIEKAQREISDDWVAAYNKYVRRIQR